VGNRSVRARPEFVLSHRGRYTHWRYIWVEYMYTWKIVCTFISYMRWMWILFKWAYTPFQCGPLNMRTIGLNCCRTLYHEYYTSYQCVAVCCGVLQCVAVCCSCRYYASYRSTLINTCILLWHLHHFSYVSYSLLLLECHFFNLESQSMI